MLSYTWGDPYAFKVSMLACLGRDNSPLLRSETVVALEPILGDEIRSLSTAGPRQHGHRGWPVRLLSYQ
ncbi:hypothetical protein SRHO_G00318770 [Serrasalmus rhombeus]